MRLIVFICQFAKVRSWCFGNIYYPTPTQRKNQQTKSSFHPENIVEIQYRLVFLYHVYCLAVYHDMMQSEMP